MIRSTVIVRLNVELKFISKKYVKKIKTYIYIYIYILEIYGSH